MFRLAHNLIHDFRFGLRLIRRSRLVALGVVISLGLGIGATASVFSFLDFFLFRPLPVPDTGSVVRLRNATPASAIGFSYPEARDYAERSQGLSGIALVALVSAALSSAAAQTAASGSITGAVRRDDGQRASGAVVVIFGTDGRPRMTRSNAEGRFTFSVIPAGSYVIQGCAEEFGPSSPANVGLRAGMDLTQDVTMSAGFVRTAEPSCSIDAADVIPVRRPQFENAGKIISLDLNGDIRDFFRSIAAVSGLDLDVAPAINRVVAVHLKDIPWDLALDVVLKTAGLGIELDGKALRITPANPALGQDRVLMETTTIEGIVTEFKLQTPGTLLQLNAPNAGGTMQTWPVEWESPNYLTELGIRPNTLQPGDRIIVTGAITRTNTIRLIGVMRPSDGFSWGYLSLVHSASSDGLMFVSSSLQ